MLTLENHLGGRPVAAEGGAWLDVFEPATGQVYAKVARSSEKDVARAVEAAQAAFPAWSSLPAAERSRLLLAAASRIEQDLERFAQAESQDTGKPIALARSLDIPRAVANLRFFATAILHDRSECHATDYRALNYTLRRPRGVAGLISPWNLPLYLLTWKVAPALATGNTVVAKPSELTPLTATLLAQTFAEVGLPAGAFNLVHGLGAEAGAALVAHPRVLTISFTGGTTTGAAIAQSAAPKFKKLALELGGKNPNIVFADADMDEAVATSLRSSFSNQGQICLAGSRILVERQAFDAFVERFAAATATLKQGDPLDDETDQGALISSQHRDKVLSYIQIAEEQGGTIVRGGRVPQDLPARCKSGYFVEPTIITGLGPDSKVNCEEIFGPVVTVLPFDDEAQAVTWANATPYGLSASIWTRDLARAHRLAERIAAGTVWINCWLVRDLRVPFGGMKQSGVGREGGDEALRFFTEPKNVCIQYAGEVAPR
jgi:aminomuconate-semialdehyde/2-hydroxymuconate-6-semialdehyde dehydrogenase